MRTQPRTIDTKLMREGWRGIVQWPRRKSVTPPFPTRKQALIAAVEIAAGKGGVHANTTVQRKR